MAASPRRPKWLKVNQQCPPNEEINILLLGQTGIGKTTFINAFANYLVHDTLDDAINGEMRVIIPTSFSFTDPETFEEKSIQIGDKDDNRKITENGQSCTQQCQSFVFPVGDRNLRLIDTPGMGDTRGSEQDNKNLFEILTYISHYEHLNGICIFLKPNEERLTISFRLCIKQILHYLHEGVRENMIFIFTSARSTFFRPGGSKKLLQVLLDEQRGQDKLEVPFSKENTYLLDNESFRCLALRKNEIKVNDEQMENYKDSWHHTVGEYQRLMTYISTRSLYGIAGILSLNEAEQLIRKLSRPIAITLKVIQQNIQFATDYKQNLLVNKKNAVKKLPQNIVDIKQLPYPSLVCVHQKCSKIVDGKSGKEILYKVCNKNFYLNGVIQEAINDPRISQCDLFDNQTDKCAACGCSWEYHMNITYEYDLHLTHHDMTSNTSRNKDDQSLVNPIDKHIKDLQDEQENIKDVYNKLSKFLHINAIHPCNDDIIDYLRLFIREEQIKHEASVRNNHVIDGLTEIMTKYEHDMDDFKKRLANEKDPSNVADKLTSEEVFSQVGTLYRLAIHGPTIRQQIELLKRSEDEVVRRMERRIKLPEKAASSKIMCTLQDRFPSTISESF